MDKSIIKILFTLLVCILLGSVVNELGQIYYLSSKHKKIKIETTQIKEENRLLNKEIAKLKNDPRYISIVARKKLGMIKNGEKIYKFKN
jgi:cell division protein FtsL